MPQAKWYADGLAFECRACGNCCGGFPGYVWVTDKDVAAMAAAIQTSAGEFEDRYVIRVRGRMTLAEAEDWDCVMLGPDGRCRVYEARPVQCRTFPFWSSNLASPAAWAAAARECPGMNAGRRYSLEEIESRLLRDGDDQD